MSIKPRKKPVKKANLTEEQKLDEQTENLIAQLGDKPYGQEPKQTEQTEQTDTYTSLTINLRTTLYNHLNQEVLDNKQGNFKWDHRHVHVSKIIRDVLEAHYEDILNK